MSPSRMALLILNRIDYIADHSARSGGTFCIVAHSVWQVGAAA